MTSCKWWALYKRLNTNPDDFTFTSISRGHYIKNMNLLTIYQSTIFIATRGSYSIGSNKVIRFCFRKAQK
jgi:hypothetical protein